MKEPIRIEADTRVLDQMIKNIVNEDVGRYEIRDGVEYGIYQELGFLHHLSGEWVQNPFMVPAFEQETKNINELIGKTIETQGSLDDLFKVIANNIAAVAITLAPRTPTSAKSEWTKRSKVTGALKNSIKVHKGR